MSTIRGYGYLLTELLDFSRSRGYVYIDQWQPFDVREFRVSWGVKISTATKKMATVKAFFRYLESNRWLKENPTKFIKEKHTRKERQGENAPRIPFSDDDLTRMFSACTSQYAAKGNYRRRWDGQDLADFIAISVYTGLRISDVATFHVDRLKENWECRIRTTKGGNHISTWIPVWLQERIGERIRKHGGLIFGSHQTKDICVITDVWRRKLDKLWALCGTWATNPTHHRFRHTFARILLQRGVSVQDVAEMWPSYWATRRR
jgi:integrase